MTSLLKRLIGLAALAALVLPQEAAQGRGRGGLRRGGGARRAPSRPRPSARPSRPSRPSTRPSRPTTRPSRPSRPSPGVSRPSRPSTRPSRPTRPKPGSGTRPGGNINRPGGFRPPTRPGTGIGNRPKIPGKRPGGKIPGKRPGVKIPGKKPGGKIPGKRPPIGKRPPGKRPPGLRPPGKRPPGLRPPGYRPRPRPPKYDFGRWNRRYYRQHARWYHGGWGGRWDRRWYGRWQYRWRRYPVWMAAGVTVWGINRIAYRSGYRRYANPYYSAPVVVDGTTVVNYSDPSFAEPPYQVEDSGDQSGGEDSPPPGVSKQSWSAFETAQSAFKAGKYQDALKSVNAALKEMPRDTAVNEFRALVLFALGDYRDAAQTLYAVLSVGPGWDWTTMSGLYGSTDEYSKHLRALEQYVQKNTGKADGHFVLGYHYLTCGHNDAAKGQFQASLKINPKDAVSSQILNMLGAGSDQEPPAATGSDEKAPDIPVGSLVGTWNAKRGAATFTMKLTSDKKFTWSYTEGKQKSEMSGTFSIEGDGIALEPTSGGAMYATLKFSGKDRMNFKMIGDDDKDPGLDFSK